MFLKLLKKKNKKQKFVREFTTRLLSLELEPGWVEDITIQDPLTFFKEKEGTGALQISFVTHKDSRIPSVGDLLNNHKNAKNIKEYSLREWQVYEFENSTEEHYNKTYYFVKTGVLVFITWYGDFENNGSKELDDLTKIISSISVIHKN